MNIVTYQSSNAKSHERWLAYIVLPNGEQWLVRFTGETEEQAIAAAKNRWESEQKRYAKHNQSVTDVCNQALVTIGEAPKRGAHLAGFAGKVWVINRATHHLCRIDPGELVIYEANGYVRGGPRSK